MHWPEMREHIARPEFRGTDWGDGGLKYPWCDHWRWVIEAVVCVVLIAALLVYYALAGSGLAQSSMRRYELIGGLAVLGCLLVFRLLPQLVNSTRIICCCGAVLIERGPLYWTHRQRISCGSVADVKVVGIRTGNSWGEPGEMRRRRYSLVIVHVSDRRTVLLSRISTYANALCAQEAVRRYLTACGCWGREDDTTTGAAGEP